jgi:hypothetical protein
MAAVSTTFKNSRDKSCSIEEAPQRNYLRIENTVTRPRLALLPLVCQPRRGIKASDLQHGRDARATHACGLQRA